MKSLRPWLMVWVVLLACIGGCALLWAGLNLVGVPMQERQSMNPGQGWISVGLAIACFILAIVIYRRSQ